MDSTETIGLAIVGCYLGKKLAIADACRGGETCNGLNLSFDFLRDIYSEFYAFLVVCDIEESLVDRDRFDEVGILLKDVMYLMGNFSIILIYFFSS